MPVLFPSNRHSVPPVLFALDGGLQMAGVAIGRRGGEARRGDFFEGCNFSLSVEDISTIRAESCCRITLPFIDTVVFALT